jgi:adenylosuccinate synthase
MGVTALIGAFWGDEGKGNVAAFLARSADYVCRFQGGPNAAHTVYLRRQRLVFRMLPAGMLSGASGVLGAGMAIDPELLLQEVRELERHIPDLCERLFISENAHIITRDHLSADRGELSLALGTTKRGVGPCYASKIGRVGIRVRQWKAADDGTTSRKLFLKKFGDNCVDTGALLRTALKRKQSVVAEGAQGTLLDVDHGDYPFVTSCNTTVGAVLTGLGIGPKEIENTILVTSAYLTKIGTGRFPTRLRDPAQTRLRKLGHEFDHATNLWRDCGWLDLDLLKYSAAINGADGIILTKVDVLAKFRQKLCVRLNKKLLRFAPWEGLQRVRRWSELPDNLTRFVTVVEQATNLPVLGISIGPRVEQMVTRDLALFWREAIARKIVDSRTTAL